MKTATGNSPDRTRVALMSGPRGSDISATLVRSGELPVAVFILEHPAIALKDGSGFHGEGPSRDIAIDYRAWTELNAFMTNHISVDGAADHYYSDVDVTVYQRGGVDDQRSFLRQHLACNV